MSRRGALLLALLTSVAAHAAALPGCVELSARLPNLPVRLCEQAGLQAGDARSVQGTPLYVRDVPATGAVYWEKRTRKDPRRWPGPRPLSEPESRFLHAQMEAFRPHLIVSIHAPYGILDFDGPSVPPSRLGRLYLDQVGIFPGSLGNYGGIQKAVPVVTIELPNAQRTPLDAEMRQMWVDLLRWMSERLGPATGPATGPAR